MKEAQEEPAAKPAVTRQTQDSDTVDVQAREKTDA